MLKPLRIPTISQSEPVVDGERKPTNYFLRTLNGILKSLGDAVLQLQQLPLIQDALAALDAATQAAQAAADAATAAAGDSMAQSAANAREASLQASYIDPSSVLSADTTTITVAAHTRIYPSANGGAPTSVQVAGGTVPATAQGETDYVSYSDPDREGGTVTYIASITPPVQTGSTHVVGAVTIPETGTVEGGDGPQRPGYVQAKLASQNETE